MIDDSKTLKFESPGEINPPPTPKFHWKSLPLSLLLQYRDEINSALPSTELSKMNMEEEMLLQYHAIRELQNDIIGEDTIPPNQKAQVANAVAASLNKLAELQASLYTTERFKNIENILIRNLSKLPEEIASEFLTEYEKEIDKA